MLWSLIHFASCKWELEQIIKPSLDNYGIFGRSVGVSEDKIVVGASWETTGSDSRLGALYIFQLDQNTNKYKEVQKLIPYGPEDKSIILNNTGSTCQVSRDGKRIVAGAPYSTVKGFEQVGAIVVFDYDEQKQLFTQTKIITPVENPTESDAYQGFGRSLTITSDGKTIASGYYNKPNVVKYIDDHGAVFITTETVDGWTTPTRIDPPSINENKRFKFGSDLQFIDNSHLIVAVDLFDSYFGMGSCYYTRSGSNDWTLTQQILPEGISNGEYNSKPIKSYGSKIGMPNQKTLATMVAYKKDLNPNGAFFIISFSNDKWNTDKFQVIEYPPDVQLTGLAFCGDSIFMTHASNITDTRNPDKKTDAILIFRRDSSGKFELSSTETLYPEENPPELLNFASDLAWGHDCNSIVVGGMTKYKHDDSHPEWSDQPSNESRAYVYKLTSPYNPSSNKAVIVICSLLACIAVVAVIGVVIYCARKHKGMIKIDKQYGSKINEL
ncbi:hypothetical protein TVAG_265780 [Trichomonas vaginalis G3]|uniref:Uncharacterized protein n=1 Tax=Trichomonas vaginalis (strain ATCC PRA-98 / G3) TaxID=412133 RepID=A2F2H5_TRIV3|nr:hypothetical protein TVAGG3_0980440 [Trichomonas vaginalis G3]EAY00875.1 hypothetical protein TVAG_265780 [Trichomonas vaginalis G3]KAI5489252.1 hypothetical protein TVAGG3_0980440 [Trichomonas vaginalis G3]|eukprot:XP_001313804.1 hypothetical protein [Trichomonas vaginalis G3]